MSLTTITDHIKAEATKRIAEINAEAEARCEQLTAEAGARMVEVKAAAEQITAKKIAQQNMATTSQAKQSGSLLVQNAKRQVLDDIFAAAYTELQQLSGDEYVAFYTKKVEVAKLDELTIERILVPSDREVESKQIIQNLNISAPIETSPSVQAGLRLLAGAHSYDFSLDTLFAEQRTNLEVTVVNDLFNTN